MKILLAHDGSPQADKALEEAVKLCQKFDAALAILNVVPDLCLSAAEVSPNDCAIVSHSLLADAQGALKRAADAAAAKGVTAETLLRDGRPVEQILETAGEIGASYIVIGSTGKHGAKKFLMGSVSSKVAEYAACTVLLVK